MSVTLRSVSFGNTNTFNDLIAKPQAYAKTETPAAASSIKDGEKKSHKGAKVAAALAAGVVLAGTLAAVGNKQGWFKVKEVAEEAAETAKKSEFVKKAVEGIDGIGKKINEVVAKIMPKAKDVVETVVETAEPVA